jgi:hypothetical protein
MTYECAIGSGGFGPALDTPTVPRSTPELVSPKVFEPQVIAPKTTKKCDPTSKLHGSKDLQNFARKNHS